MCTYILSHYCISTRYALERYLLVRSPITVLYQLAFNMPNVQRKTQILYVCCRDERLCYSVFVCLGIGV